MFGKKNPAIHQNGPRTTASAAKKFICPKCGRQAVVLADCGCARCGNCSFTDNCVA